MNLWPVKGCSESQPSDSTPLIVIGRIEEPLSHARQTRARGFGLPVIPLGLPTPLARRPTRVRRASRCALPYETEKPPKNDRQQHQVICQQLCRKLSRALLSSLSRFPSLSIRLALRPSLMVIICRLAIAPWPELSSPRLSAVASHVQHRTCPFHICNALIARRVSHFSSSALLHLETRHQASIPYSKLRFYSLPVVCKQHSQAA
jgi:hypothetical protein